MGIQLPYKGAQHPHFSAQAYCGEMAGWIKMSLDTEVDLGPWPHCVWWAQLPLPRTPPEKGAQHTPSIRSMSIVAKRSPISAITELLLYNRKINMTFEDKIKTTYEEVTENSDASSKNMKSELKKINYDVVDAS